MNGKAELFARGMLGSFGVGFADYDVKGSAQGNQFAYTRADKVAFYAATLAAGLGIEVLFRNIGVSAGYTYNYAVFDRLSSGSVTDTTLTKNLNASIGMIDVVVTYHLGKPNEPKDATEEEKKG